MVRMQEVSGVSRSWFYLTFESSPAIHQTTRLTAKISRASKEAVIVSAREAAAAGIRYRDLIDASVRNTDRIGIIVTRKSGVTHIVRDVN